MNRIAIPALALVCLVLSAAPAGAASGFDAAWPLPERLAWQIALDAAGFSPGLIDGRIGRKTDVATREYQQANNLKVSGILDAETAKALAWDPRKALTTYTIVAADLDEVGPLPKDWNQKARLPKLRYPSLEELVAEKFHCTRGLLGELNPGVDLGGLKAGQTLNVPAVRPPVAPAAAVEKIEVDLKNKYVRPLAADGRTLALFHCSVAADKADLPSGKTSVVVIQHNPAYSFDPAKWPEVHNVHQKLLIPPGPRNPVGLCWIGLGLSGYGIHGTPQPENIGKTGSHGCIRLANWDAVRLGNMVRVGTAVSFR